MSEKPSNTAARLGAYRFELIEQGFDADEAFQLVRDVAERIHAREALIVTEREKASFINLPPGASVSIAAGGAIRDYTWRAEV